MAYCLLAMGAVALAAWPLGWLPDGPGPVCAAAVAAGGRPVGSLYRTRPVGRRSAAAAMLLVMSALAVAGSAAAAWVSPSAEDLGFGLGALVGVPLGAAAFTWRVNRSGRAVSESSAGGTPPRPHAGGAP
ncbi:hypothetical protein PV392_12025 [Streptomyces sp. ME03-5709C]|nr:hypothetical protein [Streptomyces sp. ME03-5709C]